MSSLSAKIQDVFNEPGCGKNANKSEAERKKGCTKQLQPGGAAGGCAFDGAKIALQPLTDVAHLVHGPIACEGNSWDIAGRGLRDRISGAPGSPPTSTKPTSCSAERSACTGGQGNHRKVQSTRGLRLPDLRARHDRRRHQRGLQSGQPEVRQARNPGQFSRLRRTQESRQQAGR